MLRRKAKGIPLILAARMPAKSDKFCVFCLLCFPFLFAAPDTSGCRHQCKSVGKLGCRLIGRTEPQVGARLVPVLRTPNAWQDRTPKIQTGHASSVYSRCTQERAFAKRGNFLGAFAHTWRQLLAFTMHLDHNQTAVVLWLLHMYVHMRSSQSAHVDLFRSCDSISPDGSRPFNNQFYPKSSSAKSCKISEEHRA